MTTSIDASSPIPGGLPAALERARASQSSAAGTAAQSPVAASKGRGDDTVQITGDAMQLHNLGKSLSSGPALNSEKVEAVKLAIAEGRYAINPERIAARLMSAEAAFA